MTSLLITMGTAATENQGINDVLPFDRPKVYPCSSCGNGFQFTKRGLEIHRKYCSHKEICSCLPCRYKSQSFLEKRTQSSFEQSNESSFEQSTQFLLEQNTQSLLEQNTQSLLEENSQSLLEENSQSLLEQSTQSLLEQSTQSFLEQNTQSSLEQNTQSSLKQNTLSLLEHSAQSLPEQSTQSLLEPNTQPSLQQSTQSSLDPNIQCLSEQSPQTSLLQSNKIVADIKNENILNDSNKIVKLSNVIETGNIENDSGTIVEKLYFATKSLPVPYSESKVRKGRSESSDSWEDSHSDDSQQNQNKTPLHLKPVSVADSKSKLSKGKPTENSENLENNHDGEPCNRKIFCVICDKHIFWESFGTHVLQHSIKIENSHLVCPQCNQAYRSPNLYLMHFPCHLVNHDCLDCHCDHPKCFKRSAVPSPEHSYAGDSTCFICLKTLNGNPSIVTHLKIHCKECPFTCEECNRSFRQTGNLQRHMLAHRGEKPHKCPSCGTGFSDPATLRNHVRTHTKETPFVCKVCKRGFSQVGNLKRHMALHVMKEMDAPMLFINGGENEKSIGVFAEKIGPDDEKSSGSDLFSDSEAQKIGNASVEDELETRTRRRGRNGQFKLHVCKLCGKKYAWRHDLNIHFRTHTGEKPYKCDKCDKKFAQSGAVRMHHARHHSKPKLNPKKITKLKIVHPIST